MKRKWNKAKGCNTISYKDITHGPVGIGILFALCEVAMYYACGCNW